MPRKMPAGLLDLFARKDKQIESHTTAQIEIDNGDIMRNYFFASGELMIDGATYTAQLRKGSQIKSSLARASDQASFELQNVDTELGLEFLSLGQALYGATAKIGRHWRDIESGAEFHKVFLTGPIVGLQINEDAVAITVVSEPYANISVGASRRVAPSCQWTFRDPTTCQFAGSLLTCNFLLNHADGCQGRHGDPLKRAKFGGFAFLNSQSRLKTL
jgi:hypothetical protein